MVHKGLELAEKTKDTVNIMALNEGLGAAYNDLQNPRKALFYLHKANRIADLKGFKYDKAGIMIDIGNVYQSTGKFDSAAYFYKKGLDVTSETGDKKRKSVAISNLARVKILAGDYNSALSYAREAVKISSEISYKKGWCEALINESESLYNLGNFKDALAAATRAKELSFEMGTKKESAESFSMLSKIYDKLGNIREAYFSFKRSNELKDSLENGAQFRMLSGLEVEYEKVKLEQEKRYRAELNASELKKQKQIRNLILVTGIILFAILLFILRSYAAKQKANREILRQKQIIEEKNLSILTSINYSKQIQDAILPSAIQVKQMLPESFILFEPKDIVSGDFYFIDRITIASSGKWVAVALADCTGHGVPGALMSMTGYNLLRQSINEPNVTSPGEALDYLNRELNYLLRQDQKEVHIRDGMDISFCAINLENNMLMFSGANNPLWILSASEKIRVGEEYSLSLVKAHDGKFLHEIKADKQHVGFNESQRPFNTVSAHLSPGDLIYLFTDGYADQFGGPNGKKFKYKQLAEKIFECSDMHMEQQRLAFREAFHNWKGDLGQVDDVSLVGIRI
jgi:serine phosphatase RsbU (regulator of sigma subunit)